MRTLISKRVVDETPKEVKLVIETKCPQKWLFVDLENGNVWVAIKYLNKYPRWRCPTRQEITELKKVASLPRGKWDVAKAKGEGEIKCQKHSTSKTKRILDVECCIIYITKGECYVYLQNHKSIKW